MIRKPMEPSSDRGIFFRLILSFTTISSVSLLFLLQRQEEEGNHRKGRREEGKKGRREEGKKGRREEGKKGRRGGRRKIRE